MDTQVREDQYRRVGAFLGQFTDEQLADPGIRRAVRALTSALYREPLPEAWLARLKGELNAALTAFEAARWG